jgi:hypothetical protein
MTSISAKSGGIWGALHDPRVRAGLYLWILVGMLCIAFANAMAAQG